MGPNTLIILVQLEASLCTQCMYTAHVHTCMCSIQGVVVLPLFDASQMHNHVHVFLVYTCNMCYSTYTYTVWAINCLCVHVSVNLYDIVHWCLCREELVRELEGQVQEMKDSVSQLQLERTELHTKACWRREGREGGRERGREGNRSAEHEDTPTRYSNTSYSIHMYTCTQPYMYMYMYMMVSSPHQIEAGEGASTAISQLEQEKVLTIQCTCIYTATEGSACAHA